VSDSTESSAADLAWNDLLRQLANVYSIVESTDGSVILQRTAHLHQEILRFGPQEWYSFLCGPEAPTTDSGEPPRVTNTPIWAWDELMETMGSKGSPLVIRDGYLRLETPRTQHSVDQRNFDEYEN